MLTQSTIKTARLLVEAMKTIHASDWLTSPMTYKTFGISGPAIDGDVFASIVNDSREGTYGVELAVGPRALEMVTLKVEGLLGLVPVDQSFFTRMHVASNLTAVWTPLHHVPPHLRQLPTTLGYSGRRETVIPELVVSPIVGDEREMRPPELRLMLLVLRCLIRADELGMVVSHEEPPFTTIRRLRMIDDTEPIEISASLEQLDIEDDSDNSDPFERAKAMPCPDSVPDGDPANTSPAEWRVVGMAATSRVTSKTLSRWLGDDRQARRYFGDAVTAEEMFDKYEGNGVVPAFAQWLAANAVDRATGMTTLDAAIAASTSRLERAVLEAWRESSPTLWRVAEVEPGVSIRLVDLVDGTERLVTDKGLSQSLGPGHIMPGLVFCVGGCWFFLVAGPPLGGFELVDVLEELEEAGLPLTRAALSKKPHLFGRLFAWIDRRPTDGPLPQLQNTDGEPMVLGHDRYTTDDAELLRLSLAAMKDIEYRPDEDEFSWFRVVPRESKSDPEQWTLLGRIEILGNEVIVDANSENRRRLLRQRLERIPGVRFVEFVHVDDLPQESFSSPEPSVELTEELIGAIKKMIHAKMMAWLDEPVPAFQGKTPRQHAKTAAGKAQVRAMILGLPAPYSQGGVTIEPPRAAMLREIDKPDSARSSE